MSSKLASRGPRVVSKIDWEKFRSLLPGTHDASYFNALKAKNDAYIAKVNSLPASLPKIDFDHYRKVARNQSTIDKIDNLERVYSKVNISAPKDSTDVLKQIDDHLNKCQKIMKDKIVELRPVKANLEVDLKKYTNFPPVEEWNPEMWMYYLGDDAAPNFAKLKTHPEIHLNRLLQSNYDNL
ncbi:hypothetical protein ACOME3_010157 [Neoechinorhynchus agilis]